jgi:iron(III) transport system permease protein
VRSARAAWGLLACGLALLVAWRLADPGADLAPLGRSLDVAVRAAAAALVLGLAGGWLLAHRLPFGRALLVVAAGPLVIPPFIAALGWIDLVGPGGRLLQALGGAPAAGPTVSVSSPLYTTWACGLLLAASFQPIVLLAVRAALLRVDPAALDAARLARGRAGVRRILLAAALPSAVAGALVVLVLALLERPTPLLVLRGLAVPVQIEQVAVRFATDHRLGPAGLAGLPIVAIALLAAGGLLLLWRRTPPRLGRPAPLEAGPGLRRAGPALALLLATPGLWAPLASLAIQVHALPSTSLRTSEELELVLSPDSMGDATRSIAVGGLVALAAVLLGGLVAWPQRRRTGALGVLLAGALLALAVAPPPVIGVGLLTAFTPYAAMDWFTDGLPILVAASLLRFLPVAAALLLAGLRRLDPEGEDAARLCGRWPVRVAAPQLAATALVAALIVYVLAVTEYGASAVVEPPGASVLAVFVVNEAHYGGGPALIALLVLLLLVAAVPPLVLGAAGGLAARVVLRARGGRA